MAVHYTCSICGGERTCGSRRIRSTYLAHIGAAVCCSCRSNARTLLVRALLSAGSAPEVGELLGVSRQRVWQLAYRPLPWDIPDTHPA